MALRARSRWMSDGSYKAVSAQGSVLLPGRVTYRPALEMDSPVNPPTRGPSARYIMHPELVTGAATKGVPFL